MTSPTASRAGRERVWQGGGLTRKRLLAPTAPLRLAIRSLVVSADRSIFAEPLQAGLSPMGDQEIQPSSGSEDRPVPMWTQTPGKVGYGDAHLH